MPTNPTTREIAKASGYDQSTVSRALGNSPKISDKTRQRILEVAEGMGWRPNPLASAYMSHLRTTKAASYQATIAFFNTNPKNGKVRDLPYFLRRHYDGAHERARELGYDLESIWLHEPGLNARSLSRILRSRNIPGLIIPSIIQASPLFYDFDWHNYASAAMGFSLSSPQLHRVAPFTYHGFEMAIRKTLELGYQRVAVITPLAYDQRVNHGLLSAAYYMQHQLQEDQSISILTLPGDGTTEMDTIINWIKTHRPQAVVGVDIVWKAIQKMRWRVPQDVAFVSTDWAPEFPAVGGLNQRHELHGALAVDLVVTQLLQNERGIPKIPKFLLVEGKWEHGLSIPSFKDLPHLSESAHL